MTALGSLVASVTGLELVLKENHCMTLAHTMAVLVDPSIFEMKLMH